MVLSRDDLRDTIERALSTSRADEAQIKIVGYDEGNFRFANNAPTTNAVVSNVSAQVTSVFGRRVGHVSTTQLGAGDLERALRSSEEIARLSPESEEHVSNLGPQNYATSNAWDEQTAALTADEYSRMAEAEIGAAVGASLTAAGFIESGRAVHARGNSAGLFAWHAETHISSSVTMRTTDGRGSGWSAGESHRFGALDAASLASRAVETARMSYDPIELEPGEYTVILAPSAMGDMLNVFYEALDRRSADEGRSFFSRPEGGVRIGEKLFNDNVSIYSDHTHPLAPTRPWGEGGIPLSRTDWVTDGVQKELMVTRYWANERELRPVPRGTNLIMDGGTATLDEMIASVDRGLLVTSFWYIREVDAPKILHTGLTRDGLFLIEKGRITRPVVNFRWNESPAAVLRGVEMMTPAERVVLRENFTPTVCPAAKIRAFRFTSVSPST